MRLEEITRKLASNSPITFVTYKRFAVLFFFLPSCCINSMMIGVSRTTPMGGGFRFEACLALVDVETIPSAVGCSTHRVFCCLIVGIHALVIFIPLSLWILIG